VCATLWCLMHACIRCCPVVRAPACQYEAKDAKSGVTMLNQIKLPGDWEAVRVSKTAECFWNRTTGELSRMHPGVFGDLRRVSYVGDGSSAGAGGATSNRPHLAPSRTVSTSMLLDLAHSRTPTVEEAGLSSSSGSEDEDDWSASSSSSGEEAHATDARTAAKAAEPGHALKRAILTRSKRVEVNVSAPGGNSLLPVVANSAAHKERTASRAAKGKGRGKGRGKAAAAPPSSLEASAERRRQESRLARMARVRAMGRRRQVSEEERAVAAVGKDLLNMALG